MVPYVEYSVEQDVASRKSASIAAALGLEFMHPYVWHPGLLVAAAIHHGIPSVEPEVGGMGTVTPEGQKAYRNIVYRFLQHLDLLSADDYKIDAKSSVAKVIDHSDCIAGHAGFFRSRVAIGQAVHKNDLIGTIHDLAGTCLQEVRAPRPGSVGILRKFCSVQPGDRLAQLFWEISVNGS